MLSRSAATLAALAVVTMFALAGCGDSDSDPDTASDDGTTATTCSYPEAGAAAKEVDPPPTKASLPDEVDADITTTAGEIEIELDAANAPCTVNSFLSLADQGYFDDTTCHRLTTSGILVLQCGDPTASGSGGPGYSFDDELDSLPKADADGTIAYPAGTLAMANAGPSTNGSQFFIVYGDSRLPPAYTVFGTVDDDGLEVVKDIAAKGTADGGPDGAPLDEVKIEKVTTGD